MTDWADIGGSWSPVSTEDDPQTEPGLLGAVVSGFALATRQGVTLSALWSALRSVAPWEGPSYLGEEHLVFAELETGRWLAGLRWPVELKIGGHWRAIGARLDFIEDLAFTLDLLARALDVLEVPKGARELVTVAQPGVTLMVGPEVDLAAMHRTRQELAAVGFAELALDRAAPCYGPVWPRTAATLWPGLGLDPRRVRYVYAVEA